MDKDKIKSLYILCGELSQQLRVEIIHQDLVKVAHPNLNLYPKENPWADELLKKADEFLESIKDEVGLFDEL